MLTTIKTHIDIPFVLRHFVAPFSPTLSFYRFCRRRRFFVRYFPDTVEDDYLYLVSGKEKPPVAVGFV